jgi:hypothetical protein
MMTDRLDRDRSRGPATGGLLGDARLLSGLAAGLAAAILLLWSMRGLPLGVAALWLTPLPLFLAGLGFGLVSLGIALIVAGPLLLALGGSLPAALFLGAMGGPAVALLLAARPGPGGLALPFALLGIIPALGILVAALLLADQPGGLEGVLSQAARIGAARMGLAAGEAMIAELARVKAAAIGFWLVLALLLNAAAAAGLLRRMGLLAEGPRLRLARLPGWYLLLPGAAGLFWLAGFDGGVGVSLLLALTAPLLLHALAAIHRLTLGRTGRPALLAALYVALLLFAVPMGIALSGFAVIDIFLGNRGRGAMPPAAR